MKKAEEKIIEIINSLRPFLINDGGDIEFIKYDDGYVYVKLIGACAHCEFSDITIQNGIEETLKSEIPEIKGVIKVDI